MDYKILINGNASGVAINIYDKFINNKRLKINTVSAS